jgi:hypothetical protein
MQRVPGPLAAAVDRTGVAVGTVAALGSGWLAPVPA